MRPRPDLARRLVRRLVRHPTLLGAATLAAATLAAATALPGQDTVRVDSVRVDGVRQDSLRLRLNIPAFRMEVWRDSAMVHSFGVAVGTTKYRTPVGEFMVDRVVWNPWWIPPRSWWARREKVTPPGADNPMGPVKLLLGGEYYVHGTPFPGSIGSAASHGCMRMRRDDVIALARIVQAHSGLAPSDSAIAALLADTTRTDTVRLTRPVPLRIVYELAEVRQDTLHLHPDIYARAPGRLRALAMEALHRAGRDTTLVDRKALADSVRRARRRTVKVGL